MTAWPRITLHAIALLAFLLMPGLSRNAQAAPIDNSVDIDWQNGRFLVDGFPTGGLFTLTQNDLAGLAITITIETIEGHGILHPKRHPSYDAFAASDLAGFELLLNVGSDLAEIEALFPLSPQLDYGAGEDPKRARTFVNDFPTKPASHLR